jgi:putative ABC transport system permease protein
MNSRRLIKRNLIHYWRTHLGVVCGAAVCTAVLTGALVVGDSVKESLIDLALSRLGGTEVALETGNRFFRSGLADDLSTELAAPVAPILHLKGVVVAPDGEELRYPVDVYGVDDRFWKLGAREPPGAGFKPPAAGNRPLGAGNVSPGAADPPSGVASGGFVINDALAARVGVTAGGELLVRVAKPQLLPREAPLSRGDGLSQALRLPVRAVAPDDGPGRFSLLANQATPCNVFLPLAELNGMVGLAGKANLLLAGTGAEGPVTPDRADRALKRSFHLADLGLEVRALPGRKELELRTERLFLDAEIDRAAAEAGPGAVGILTYFVIDLSANGNRTPYSFVTALGPLRPGVENRPLIPGLPGEMGRREIAINQWLADDLDARVGDELDMTCFVFAPGRRLEERTTPFHVRAIVPLEGAAADGDLMPRYPGLAEGKSCRDWDPGIAIDLSRIEPEDEAYWAEYRGTPKAFISLDAGRDLWGSRFGALTAVRYPAIDVTAASLEKRLRDRIDPAAAGLFFRPVREEALAAGTESLDFGPLFLGLSFFLFGAALILTALLFSLNVDQRRAETGTLLALGFTSRRVAGIVLGEGIVLAVAGALAGTAVGVAYTSLLLGGLGTVWRDAVAGAPLELHVNAGTLFTGGAAGIVLAVAAMAITLGRQTRRTVGSLLAGPDAGGAVRRKRASRRPGFRVAAGAFVAAAALLIPAVAGSGGGNSAGAGSGGSGAGLFFGSGALLLLGGLGLVHGLLAGRSAATGGRLTLASLGRRNAARRRGRSLAVTAVLACGAFLVFSVAANRKNPHEEAGLPGSGTGGFAFVGESSLPVLHGLDTGEGERALGINAGALSHASVVNIRLRDGDDASCLNLNRARHPSLLGLSPGRLREKRSFTFVATAGGRGKVDPWALLEEELPGGLVPAVADQATILWGLDRKVGDALEYVDEKGRPFTVQLVGALKSSVFQGSLLISEKEFVTRFPSEEGYRRFLIGAADGREEELGRTLARAGRNVGFSVTPAGDRLAAFAAVEETYLSIFQALGGLGLLLGCGGLAFVLLRNVMERRGELALLRAAGFTGQDVRKLLFLEHGGLLAAGLCCGTAAACVAVWPAVRSLGGSLPWLSLALTLAAIAVGGVFWIRLAALCSVGRDFLGALRNE